MGKKINEDTLTIRKLIASGVNQAEITRLLKVTRQKVSYWYNKNFKLNQKRKKKFSQFYVDKIIRLARNKTTSGIIYKNFAKII